MEHEEPNQKQSSHKVKVEKEPEDTIQMQKIKEMKTITEYKPKYESTG